MDPRLRAGKEELIDLLRNLGASVGSNTNLTVRQLDQKLVTLLDKCQAVSEIPQLVNDDGFVDVDNFPEYSLKDEESFFDEIQRFTEVEIRNISRRQSLGMNPHVGVENQAFYDLRQSLAHIGGHFDAGHRRLIVNDEEKLSTICIRIIEVRKVADRTPLFLVVYKHYLDEDALIGGLGWLQECFGPGVSLPIGVDSTIAEQHLLLRLLESNSKRVPNSSQRPLESTEKLFNLSFILPVATISREVAQNTMNSDVEAFDACAVCGKTTKSYCGACHAIYYCAPAHARKDWKVHKLSCRILSGAEWIDLPFNTRLNGRTAILNHNVTTLTSAGIPPKGPPPNIHHSRPFIIKLQIPVLLNKLYIIYDETRAFQVVMPPEDCQTDSWKRIISACKAHGPLGVKLYMWARRTAEYELSVAVNRLPDQAKVMW